MRFAKRYILKCKVQCVRPKFLLPSIFCCLSLLIKFSLIAERFSFMQWNWRGLFRNLDDGRFILQKQEPLAFCLQETYRNTPNITFLIAYKVFRKDHLTASSASRGVAILADRSVPACEIFLDTTLEVVAV